MGLIKFNVLKFSDTVKYIKIQDKVLSTFGKNSYCVAGVIQFATDEFGMPICHLAVGNYVSMAQVENFYLALNHDYTCVTTAPLYKYYESVPRHLINKMVSRYQTIIGNDVWIGNDCTILEGVYVGNGAVIGAHSVVTKDVPPYAIVAGNPARIVKYRFSEDVITKMQKIKWWYWTKQKMEEALPYMSNPEIFADKYYNNGVFPDKFSDIYLELEKLRLSGKKIYCLPVGSPQGMNEYKILIEKYFKEKNTCDNIALLLLIEPDLEDRRIRDEVSDWVNSKGAMAPAAYCYNISDDENMYNVLANIDCLITTHTAWSMKCLDYASEYEVKHHYVMDIDVLD